MGKFPLKSTLKNSNKMHGHKFLPNQIALNGFCVTDIHLEARDPHSKDQLYFFLYRVEKTVPSVYWFFKLIIILPHFPVFSPDILYTLSFNSEAFTHPFPPNWFSSSCGQYGTYWEGMR